MTRNRLRPELTTPTYHHNFKWNIAWIKKFSGTRPLWPPTLFLVQFLHRNREIFAETTRISYQELLMEDFTSGRQESLLVAIKWARWSFIYNLSIYQHYQVPSSGKSPSPSHVIIRELSGVLVPFRRRQPTRLNVNVSSQRARWSTSLLEFGFISLPKWCPFHAKKKKKKNG